MDILLLIHKSMSDMQQVRLDGHNDRSETTQQADLWDVQVLRVNITAGLLNAMSWIPQELSARPNSGRHAKKMGWYPWNYGLDEVQ